VLVVALALGAALSWGCGDFLGGRASRTLHVVTVLALSQVAGALAVGAWVLVGGGSAPSLRGVLWAMGAGLAGLLGLGGLYRGMAIGAMSVVAPISAAAAVVPFVVGVASGERPGSVRILGAALALAGIVLVSREPHHAGGGRAAGVGLALVAALGFGLYFVGIDRAATEGAAWAVLVARSTASAVAVVVALSVGAALVVRGRSLGAVVAVGLLDSGANVLFALATSRGLVSIVSVLASLYPVVTVALARLVLAERIGGGQWLGAAAALSGAALITAG
jgi:drug/metabolite transporter (DMT)-like permease